MMTHGEIITFMIQMIDLTRMDTERGEPNRKAILGTLSLDDLAKVREFVQSFSPEVLSNSTH